MPINLSLNLPERRRQQQLQAQLEGLRGTLLGTQEAGPPTRFGEYSISGGLVAPTPQAQLVSQLLQPATAEFGIKSALDLLEQQRQADLEQAKLSQQQSIQQQIAQALSGIPTEGRPGLSAIAQLAQIPGQSEEALKALYKQLEPVTLSAEQQRISGLGQQIAIAPKKASDLEAEREKLWADATGLRKEFTTATKPYADQNSAYGRVIASAQDPSPAGDLALIFNYMKVLDPGSTVREGEFAQVGAAGGLPTQVQRLYEQWATGNKLTLSQREDVVDRATRLFKQASKEHKITAMEFERLAKSRGVKPGDVIFERQTVTPPQQRPPLSSFER